MPPNGLCLSVPIELGPSELTCVLVHHHLHAGLLDAPRQQLVDRQHGQAQRHAGDKGETDLQTGCL
jgi:hypothetical protein